MAGVGSEGKLGWLGTSTTREAEVWPVFILSTDSDKCLVKWVPGGDKKVLPAFTVEARELKEWENVAGSVLTPVAQEAYDGLIKADSTIVDVIAKKKRVRNIPILFGSPIEKTAGPIEKKPRKNPATPKSSSAKKSVPKPSPAKKAKKVKHPIVHLSAHSSSSLQQHENPPPSSDEERGPIPDGTAEREAMQEAVQDMRVALNVCIEARMKALTGAAGNADCLLIPPLTLLQMATRIMLATAPDCGMPRLLRSAGSTLRSPGSTLRSPGSRLRRPISRIRTPSSRIRTPSSRLLQVKALSSFHLWPPSSLLLLLLEVSAGSVSVCLVCVSGLRVWSACLVCVSGMRVWYACLVCVSGMRV
jgi:hypothetical protein